MTAIPAEKSGQEEFEFEYGEDFAKHIEGFAPTFCKVLVRYNPEGDQALNRRQAARLRRLSEHLSKSKSLFMFELLVPPEKEEFEKMHGNKQAYDREIRPHLMVQAIQQLQDEGVEPDVWKIEGLDRREDCERVVAAARGNGRSHVSCIVLGRGEDENKVHEWLTVAAGRSRLHRLRCGAHGVLGSARQLARRENHPGGGRRRNRPPLSQLCRHLRGARRWKGARLVKAGQL